MRSRVEDGQDWWGVPDDGPACCKVFTLLSMFSLITIELEPDILYIKGVLNDSCDVL